MDRELKKYQVGGPITDHNKYVYAEREADTEFVEKLIFSSSNNAYSLIAHRQTGKSSLICRIGEQLSQKGWLVSVTDLRPLRYEKEVDVTTFLTIVARELLSGFLEDIEIERWLEEKLDKWGKVKYPNKFLVEAIEMHCDSGKPTLLVIDEFEAIADKGPYAQFLFDATMATLGSLKSRIVWIYVGTQSPQALIASEGNDPSKYPMFQHLSLGDLGLGSSRTIESLSSGLGFDVPAPHAVVQQVLDFTAGQPLMTCVLLKAIQEGFEEGQGVEVEKAIESRDILANAHFDYPVQQLQLHPQYARLALVAYLQLLKGIAVKDIDYLANSPYAKKIALTLTQSGLVKENLSKDLEFRSPMYRKVFDQNWAETTLKVLDASVEVVRRPKSDRNNEKRPRIGIINLGGTMGMDVDDEGNVVQPELGVYWYSNLTVLHEFAEIEEINVVEPKDGVNVVPDDWELVAKAIYENDNRNFDGFIVIMGTDSMAYAASAVAFALGDSISVPVIFTGSQTPYTVVHGDATINLMRAVQAVRFLGKQLHEVMIGFNDELYRAVRSEKKDDFRFDGFHSPSFPVLANLGERPKLSIDPERLLDNQGKRDDPDRKFTFYPNFDRNVLRISLYPGLRSQTLLSMLEQVDVSGLVMESLGIGNIPSLGDEDILQVIDECMLRKIPVLITGRYPVAPEFADQYQTATEPKKRGAIHAGNMTPAAALTKFMWVIARVKEESKSSNKYSTHEAYMKYVKFLFQRQRVGELDVGELEQIL